MNKERFTRSIDLIGEDTFSSLVDKTICIIGLGGVGGTAFESLLRTGFSNFILIDMDVVSESNLNRQILYTTSDIGHLKIEAAKKRALSINEEANIVILKIKIDSESIHQLDKYKIDFIVDAIDNLEGKIAISEYSLLHNIPLIVSLGMANRFNPCDVFITRLDKTTNDPLAKKFRHILRTKNISTNMINVVCSKELPLSFNGKLNSIMNVPSSAGLTISYYIINYFRR